MKSTRKLALVSSLVALGALLWLPQDAAAQGTAFKLTCQSDEVLAGISGRQGWWMDAIAARCRKIQSNGLLAVTPRTTQFRGGTGGTLRTFDCRRDEVMVGYSGSLGDNGFVLRVHEIVCAPWNSTTRTAGTPTRSLAGFGSTGGSGRFISGSCFEGKVGYELQGRAGMYLDRLTDIGCRYASGATPPPRVVRTPPPPPPPQPITNAPVLIGPSGNYNAVLCPDPPNPKFTWHPVEHAKNYTVEFYNDTLSRMRTRTETATRVNPPNFIVGHRYRWRVRANNTLGNGPWSGFLRLNAVEGNRVQGPCVIGVHIPPF